MSTRLLIDPRLRHTITDDLESHYFVLMWTALHWVKHDQSAGLINMEYIFDQQRLWLDGTVRGGEGKDRMYWNKRSKLHSVEFTCKPFNKLFWDLWMLFARFTVTRWKNGIQDVPDPGEH